MVCPAFPDQTNLSVMKTEQGALEVYKSELDKFGIDSTNGRTEQTVKVCLNMDYASRKCTYLADFTVSGIAPIAPPQEPVILNGDEQMITRQYPSPSMYPMPKVAISGISIDNQLFGLGKKESGSITQFTKYSC